MRNLWCLEKISIFTTCKFQQKGIVPQSLFKNLKILDLEKHIGGWTFKKDILLYSMSHREEIP
jgi:hypothetical protein